VVWIQRSEFDLKVHLVVASSHNIRFLLSILSKMADPIIPRGLTIEHDNWAMVATPEALVRNLLKGDFSEARRMYVLPGQPDIK